jgi:hypothetical protein
MLLKKLITILSHFFACPIVKKETFQLEEKLFFSRYLDGSSCLDQTARDVLEIKHIGTKEDALFEKQGFEGVVTSYGDKASTHKD